VGTNNAYVMIFSGPIENIFPESFIAIAQVVPELLKNP
jgi:hypothetical protein